MLGIHRLGLFGFAAGAFWSEDNDACLPLAAGESGLKKLARAVDAAVCSVHALVADHLQPQLEQLAFRYLRA